MNNFIKKSFLISMVLITSLFGVISVVAVPAAAVAAGDLVKTADDSAVWYIGSDNKKYVFTDAKSYATWYSNFNGVSTVAASALTAYTLGDKAVALRPGARLLQFVSVSTDGARFITASTPEVYAVDTAGALHQIDSATTATALYGSGWESMIVPVLVGYRSNYTIGAQLTSASMYPTGTLAKTADSSDVYYINGSTKRKVTDAGMTANHLNVSYAVTAASLTSYTAGTDLTAVEGSVSNPAGGTTTIVAPATGTGLTVSTAANTPDGLTVPALATNAPLFYFNLTASADGAVTVSGLTFKRQGLGDTNDFAYLYLYEGAKRLTTGKTINSTTHLVSFSNLNYQVPAGTTKTLTLSADVGSAANATSGNIHTFSLLTAASVTTTATVNGTFPVASKSTFIGAIAVGYIGVDRNGTLTNPNVGATNAKVAEFKLAVSSSEDMSLKRVSLYQNGTIVNTNLSNLKLYQGSTKLAETAAINASGLAVFDLSANPFTIARSTNKIFYVTADVSGAARPLDTIKFYLENESDVYAVGASYGYGACIDGGTTTCGGTAGTYDGNDPTCTDNTTCSDSSYTIVQGGQITVSNNGPVSNNIAKGQTAVSLLNFSINSKITAEIRSWRVELHKTGTDFDTDAGSNAVENACANDYISNIQIVDTGGGSGTSAVNCSNFSELNNTSDTGIYYTYTDYITINAGETRNYSLRADLNSSVGAFTFYGILGDAYNSTKFTFSSTGIRNTENNQYITDIVPTTYTQGTNQTIQSAGLTASLGNYRGEVTVVKGSTGVKFLEYGFTAGAGSAVTIRSIKFASYVDANGTGDTGLLQYDATPTPDVYAKDIVTKVRMYLDGALLGSEEAIDSSGYVTFDNLNWTIPANTTKTIELKGDISNNAFFNTDADRVAFDILDTTTSATYVDATDKDGNAISTIPAKMNGSNGGTTANSSTIAMTANTAYVTVQNSGTLNAYTYSEPSDTLVASAASGVTVLKVRLHATRENLKITKLRIVDTTATSYHRALSSVTLNYPYNAAGATKEVTTSLTASTTEGYVQFNDLDLYVAKDADAIVNVKANYRAVGANGAYSGDFVKLEFDDGNTASSFEVAGFDAGSNTKFYETTNLTHVAGNTTIIRKALPTFTKGTVTNNLSGSTELYKFTVASASGIAGLKAFKMYVTLNDNVYTTASLSLTNFHLKKNGSDQALVAGTDYVVINDYDPTTTVRRLDEAATTVGSTTAGGNSGSNGTSSAQVVHVVFLTEQSVEPNSPMELSISATVSGVDNTQNGKDSVLVYLDSADSASTTNNYMEDTADGSNEYVALSTSAGASDATASYIWTDYSGTNADGSHSQTALSSGDWTNGYLLQSVLGGTYSNTIYAP